MKLRLGMVGHYAFRSWCRYCVMAAARSDHHSRQADDYNEVPVISCDYGSVTDSKDDDRQLTEAEAIAVGATPILVIRDTGSKMGHADAVRCKGIEDEFPIETTTKWILGLGYPEVIIRTDGESSIVALGRGVGEKLRGSWCQGDAKHKPRFPTVDQQDTQRVVSEMRKRRFARWCATHENCTV